MNRLEHMRGLADEVHTVLTGTKTEFTITARDRNGVPRQFKGRVIRNPLMEQESVLLIAVPVTAEREQA
jgi:hypothetical protein